MASNKLIVDDDYCKSMANYCVKQGEQLEKILSDYISILETVRSKAIISGETAKALSAYIANAKKLKGQFKSISESAKTQINNFVISVDEADQYLF